MDCPQNCCHIIPAWTHYQEQLDCGTGHVCIAAVTVSPGKNRIFVAMLYNARIMVYEMPDTNNADGHSYPGAIIYSGADWRTITRICKSPMSIRTDTRIL